MTSILPQRITLVGFMGSGKTTVAPLVASRLGWQAIDSDDLLVERAGKSIPAVFAEDGEPAFRALESSVLESLKDRTRLVVATGGGAMTNEASRRAIAEGGLVFCLDVSPATSLARLAAAEGEPRPLLAGADPLGRAQELKAYREVTYALADFMVATDHLTPAAVADEVVQLYRVRGAAVFADPARLARFAAAAVTNGRPA